MLLGMRDLETDAADEFAAHCPACDDAVSLGTLADDGELVDRIRDALHATGRLSFRRIDVVAVHGEVELHGVVPCYFIKQVAQSVCLRTPGVTRVDNQLTVAATDVCVH